MTRLSESDQTEIWDRCESGEVLRSNAAGCAGLTTSGVGPGAGFGSLRCLICAPSVRPGIVFGSELSLLCGNQDVSDKTPFSGDHCGFRS